MRTHALRILHIGKYYAPHRGGIETYLETLCAATRDRMQVQVLVSNDTWLNEDSLVRSVPVHRAGRPFCLSTAPICPSMVSKIRKFDPDLVHLHLPNPGAVLAYLASGHRGPLIVGYHSDTVRQQFLGKAFQPIQSRLLRRSAAVIAGSQNYVDTSPVLSAMRNRCQVIPYGIPLDRFDAEDCGRVQEIRQRFGPRIVLSVGRLVSYKGFEHVIRAMKAVDGQLILVGSGPLDRHLKAAALEAGCANRVHFTGELDDLIPYYRAADVFVLPSITRSEAFGLVQLEAMACSKPVINTALPSGVPFVSLHGQTGITIPPADAAALSKAITLLLNDPELRARLGQAGRRRVQSQFTVEKMVDRTVSLYEAAVHEATVHSTKLGSVIKPAQWG